MNNQNNIALTICRACQTAVSKQAVSCPRCGQPLQAINYQQPQFQQNLPQIAPKKGRIGKTFGIGCLGLLGFLVVMGIISAALVPKTNNAVQNQPAQQNIQAKENPTPQQIAKKPVRKKTKEQRIDGGLIELNDEEGNPRPYSLKCFRELTEMHVLDEPKFTKGIKTAIYERCLDLNGNSTQAVQEMAKWAELNNL